MLVLAPNARNFAIKRVDLAHVDKPTRKGFFDEVELLKRLRGKEGIVRLVDHEYLPEQQILHIVLEYGEVDVLTMLKRKRKQWRNQDPFIVDPGFIVSIWRDMVRAVGVRSGDMRSDYVSACIRTLCSMERAGLQLCMVKETGSGCLVMSASAVARQCYRSVTSTQV